MRDKINCRVEEERKPQPLVSQLPSAEIECFGRITYTIGGMLLFPGDRRGGRMTIDGARGFTPRIADRMNLTLECIRRHYANQTSPLTDTLTRYGDFFTLFGGFNGYVEFFCSKTS